MDLPTFRLFILGAGFSKPAGLPLAAELLASARDEVRAHFQYHGNWAGPLEEEIEQWTKLYPHEPLNLESVLAYSHRKHYLHLIGSEEYFDHSSRSIDQVRRTVQQLLTRATPREMPALYIEFARLLRPSDVVLTFNYDTLLEDALDCVGKPYSLTPEWWLENDAHAEPLFRYVTVLKLHGSIDWYDRHYYDRAREYHRSRGHDVPDKDPLFSHDATIPTESLARGKVDSNWGQRLLPRVFRVPNHRRHFPFHTPWTDAVPFLLPPAHDKLLGQDPIIDLWENMHRTNDAYSTIVLIGYSMPQYDNYAYEALGSLLIDYQNGGNETAWKHRRVPLQIITASPSADEALQGIPFLRPTRTRVWHTGLDAASLGWLDWG